MCYQADEVVLHSIGESQLLGAALDGAQGRVRVCFCGQEMEGGAAELANVFHHPGVATVKAVLIVRKDPDCAERLSGGVKGDDETFHYWRRNLAEVGEKAARVGV